ncbi:MAG: S26 family signal peptidase [Candidatus Thermoplasmatota archaeon]|nr:S26 family signal peptidase [Candidatus Thermoplasmatota archaeon]
MTEFAREATLAIGLVTILLGSMWVATGSFPPMVVVESGSMMHEDEGSVGAIDPGDLILVMNPDRVEIVTYVEATEEANENFGYQTHGMAGDVIIYRKNGGSDTPVIHRALLKAVANSSGGWDVPGTPLVNVDSITWTLDYECYYHGGTYNLKIDSWEPSHEGYLTTGDNPDSNGCNIDQLRATNPDASETYIRGNGLKDENGNPVLAVKDEWIIGVAATEIPWLGAAKLAISGTSSQVTDSTWRSLGMVVALIIATPYLMEAISERRKED